MSLKQDLLNANRPTIKVLQPLFRTDEKFLTSFLNIDIVTWCQNYIFLTLAHHCLVVSSFKGNSNRGVFGATHVNRKLGPFLF